MTLVVSGSGISRVAGLGTIKVLAPPEEDDTVFKVLFEETPFVDSGPNNCVISGSATRDTSLFKSGISSASVGSGKPLYIASPPMAFAGDFTLHFWLRPSALTTGGSVVNVGQHLTSGFLFRRSSSISLLLRNQTVYSNSVTEMPLGQWSYVAITRVGTVFSLYIAANGVAPAKRVYQNTNVSGDFNPDNQITVFAQNRNATGDLFAGNLDDVHLHSRGPVNITTVPFLMKNSS